MKFHEYLLHFFFPFNCWHCQEKLNDSSRLFCTTCATFFEIINPHTRCSFCFSEIEQGRACSECITQKLWQVNIATAVELMGPVHTCLNELKYGKRPFFAKTAAAFMIIQFFKLRWPLPDLIVPIPKRLWFKKINHAGLLAQHCADQLFLPYASCLVQSEDSRPQAIRKEPPLFNLKGKESIEGKIILLIDDVTVTGHTFRAAAKALSAGFPKKVYSLAFAKDNPI